MSEPLTDKDLDALADLRAPFIDGIGVMAVKRLIAEVRRLRAENADLGSRPPAPPTLSGLFSESVYFDASGHEIRQFACLLCGAATFWVEGEDDFRSLHHDWHVAQGHRIP